MNLCCRCDRAGLVLKRRAAEEALTSHKDVAVRRVVFQSPPSSASLIATLAGPMVQQVVTVGGDVLSAS
jgi:hypothetical protein